MFSWIWRARKRPIYPSPPMIKTDGFSAMVGRWSSSDAVSGAASGAGLPISAETVARVGLAREKEVVRHATGEPVVGGEANRAEILSATVARI